MNNTPYCLVLGGGGAKGVYHIGVWQALKELDIPVNAFIGNSIGAIVSAYLAQGAEKELLEIANSMKLSSLIRLNENEALADENSIKAKPLSYWQGVYKNVVQRKGIDTSPMRETLTTTLKESNIRESGFDFGITTVNVSDFKPREVFIDQMEQGQLINYVLASATFPGFQQTEIEGKKYLDGGLYSNIPYTMARRRGYRKIILVDISGIGINRRPKMEGSETVYIKNSIDMGNAFDFDSDFIQQFWKLGYLDTLRTFGQLNGYQYFVTPDSKEEQQFQNIPIVQEEQQELSSLFPNEMKHDRRFYLKTLEVCASLLDIERIEQYTYASLQSAINTKLESIEQEVNAVLESRGLNSDTPSHKLLDAFVREFFENGKLADNPYFYYRLIRQFTSNRAIQLAENTLRKVHPRLEILELYISSQR